MGKLSMRKISELLRLRHALNRSYRDIGKSLNISISTVGDYLARAKTAGLSWPLPEALSEEALYAKLFLPVEKPSPKRRAPDWEWVNLELRKKGVTLHLLWREYRESYPEGYGYTSFCKGYKAYSKALSPVMHQIHKAGEKIFVDYAGLKLSWQERATGKLHACEIFVGSLGASQMTFCEASPSQQLPDWIASHIRMFDYFGGVSEIIVPDNLKASVTKAHRYDPDINANYQHLGEHYGFAIVPARVAKPKDKAKVENAVLCVERHILAPLRHSLFTSLSEMNAAIQEKLILFNHRPFQKMKTSRYALFESLDKPALKPLPQERYQYATWRQAKIHIDYHFVFDDHYYSVPYQYIHQPVEIRASTKTVECFYQEKRIAVHARSFIRYGYTTLKAHMPMAHRTHAEWTPERLKRWALKIGPQTAQFIETLIQSRAFPQQAYRACLGVLRLSQRYGEARLEKACLKAVALGMTRYQQIDSLLKKKLEETPLSPVSVPVLSLHDNIRGPLYYH